MKKSTTRAMLGVGALLLAITTLAGCSNGAGRRDRFRRRRRRRSKAKIGLLLPDSVTARYASADRPLFTAEVKKQCSGCSVIYANADGDASKQLQQAQSMLTQGVKVLVLDPFDGEAAASIVQQAKAKKVPVISYDRLIDSPDLSYYISFDNEKVGELQGQALVDALKAKKVAGGLRHHHGERLPDRQQRLAVQEGRALGHRRQRLQGARRVRHPRMGPRQGAGLGRRPDQQARRGQDHRRLRGERRHRRRRHRGPEVGRRQELPPVTGQDASLAGIQRILAGEQYMTVYKAFKPEASKAADLAIQFAKGETPKGDTTVEDRRGRERPVDAARPGRRHHGQRPVTVVKDGLYKVSKICTAQYKAACDSAGIK